LDGSKLQPDSDDYKLVFISSDSSSKDSDAELDCDWDYFEASRREEPPQPVVGVFGEVARMRPPCASCGLDVLQGLVPVPYPVPVPVPVPFAGSEADFLDALRLRLRPPPALHAWYQSLLRGGGDSFWPRVAAEEAAVQCDMERLHAPPAPDSSDDEFETVFVVNASDEDSDDAVSIFICL